MNTKRLLVICGLLGAVVLAAVVYRAQAPGSPNSEAMTETSKGKGGRRGSATGDRALPVLTQAAKVEDFAIRRRTIGTLESPAVVVVRSRIDSQVLQQHVTDGQIVKRGALLFTLDDREIQAIIARDEATIAKDQAALTQAQADLARKQELAAKRIAPQQQLDQAVATFKAAQQTVEADQAVLQADRLRLGYAKLEAPIDGRLGAIRVAVGNLVSASDTNGIATITQMNPLRVTFTLPERDLAALRAAATRNPAAPVRIYASGEPEPMATGALDFLDSSVDVMSGTISAKATFNNDAFTLWPGQFVEVEVDLDVRPNTVMLPTVSILTGQKGPYVFVAKADQTVEIRNVALVGTEGTNTAVSGSVRPGERVVVEGQMRLTDGARWTEAAPVASAGSESKQPEREPGTQP